MFTLNSVILSFFTKVLEYTKLVNIPDSVLNSTLALRGKEKGHSETKFTSLAM